MLEIGSAYSLLILHHQRDILFTYMVITSLWESYIISAKAMSSLRIPPSTYDISGPKLDDSTIFIPYSNQAVEFDFDAMARSAMICRISWEEKTTISTTPPTFTGGALKAASLNQQIITWTRDVAMIPIYSIYYGWKCDENVFYMQEKANIDWSLMFLLGMSITQRTGIVV